MIVKEAEARNLFVEMGITQAKEWTKDRLVVKLNNLPKLIANGANEPDTKSAETLLKGVCEAIQEGEEVKLEQLEVEETLPDEDVEEVVELPHPKKKHKVVEVEEDDEQQESNEEVEETGESSEEGNEEEQEEEKKPGKRGRKPGYKADKKKLKVTIPKEIAIREGIIEESNPKLVKVSYDLAKRFRDMERFPRDREMSLVRMNFLVNEILSGSFHGTTWVCAKVAENGKEFRINGNHTSNVFCQLFEENVDLDELNIRILVKEYLCESMEDAAVLYSTFDPRQSSRTKGNIVQSFAGSMEALKQIDNKVVTLATTGVAMHTWDKEYKKHDVKEQSKLMLSNPDFVTWLDKMLGKKKDNPHIWRTPVVAGMSRTWFVDVIAATEFWTSIKEGNDLPKESAQHLLYKFLHGTNIGAPSSKSEKASVSEREMFFKCIQAWNGWRKNIKVKLMYKDNSDLPTAV